MKAFNHSQFEGKFKIGDKVSFLRQAVGYERKILTGLIVGLNRNRDGFTNNTYPTAHIKAECEYGSALPYNHTLAFCELTKID